jgi:hypothetical protein
MSTDESLTPQDAHRLSGYNRGQIEAVDRCVCFYCLREFKPSDIILWIDDKRTAVCPFCDVDSVLPVFPELTDELLAAMHEYWFDKKGE